MAHADWKRYYCVVYNMAPPYQPIIWRKREDALAMLDSERKTCSMMGMALAPVGIARIRATKRNPQFQRWLLEHSR